MLPNQGLIEYLTELNTAKGHDQYTTLAKYGEGSTDDRYTTLAWQLSATIINTKMSQLKERPQISPNHNLTMWKRIIIHEFSHEKDRYENHNSWNTIKGLISCFFSTWKILQNSSIFLLYLSHFTFHLWIQKWQHLHNESLNQMSCSQLNFSGRWVKAIN